MPHKSAGKAPAAAETVVVRPGDVAIKLNGSYAEGAFQSGDVVLVERSKELHHGDFVVIRMSSNGASLCRVYDVAGERVFVSACDNSDIAPIFADSMPFEIIGKVIGIQFQE